jgi:hypothetical protein
MNNQKQKLDTESKLARYSRARRRSEGGFSQIEEIVSVAVISIIAGLTLISRFQPQTPAEEITARVTRMMLNYHILRVQLEGALPDLDESQRASIRQQAIDIRCEGFREEKKGQEAGHRVSYDDELLRREGTRIAYTLARGETDEAMRHEENIVAAAVHAALYDHEKEDMRIAA